MQRLVDASVGTTAAWDRLAELCDTFGGRLTGSRNLQLACEWAAETMRGDGLENVRLEKTMAPHWVRGEESLEIETPVPSPLVMLGLGGSVGTPADGITAPLIVVRSFDELNKRSSEVSGRVVLYDVPFTSYGQTVAYRANGAINAARHGAVAVLVRSVGPLGLRTPHTGALSYLQGTPQIPAAAVPVEDAQRLARLVARGVPVTVTLRMSAATLPDVESANVIGEIAGREHADEIVVDRRALRFLGRGSRRLRRWRRVHRHVGGRASHEEARAASPPDRARGAVHERGERPARRHGVP